MRDVRISVTDRCNFRCTYCMPKEVFGAGYPFLADGQLLTFEEIVRLLEMLTDLGVRKVRITGGEPLLKAHLEDLVRRIAGIPGVEDIALTTNGSRLTEPLARRLKEAGLNRITISLDALDDTVFRSMNDVGFPVKRVLEAIDIAADVGFSPVKVNMVVKRGVNEQEILPMAAYFRDKGHILRLIEYMDVGNTNGWRMTDVVTASQILRLIEETWTVEAVEATRPGEVAKRYRYVDGAGEIGVIASVTQPFCGGCNRLRVSSDGQLYTCLFSGHGTDIRTLFRDGSDNDTIRETLKRVWGIRKDRYSEERTAASVPRSRVEMSKIGG